MELIAITINIVVICLLIYWFYQIYANTKRIRELFEETKIQNERLLQEVIALLKTEKAKNVEHEEQNDTSIDDM